MSEQPIADRHVPADTHAPADAPHLAYTLHAPADGAPRSGCAILYFHGGGFLYGERDDLPRPYIDMMLERGHTLLCLDYPLAPECPLATCVDTVLHAVRTLVDADLNELGCSRYVLFGRSAGAYLALKIAALLRTDAPDALQPCALWDFYGYYDLTAPFANEPSAHYAAMPAVDGNTVSRLCGKPGALVTSGPKATRFSLYVYARQQGTWMEMLGIAPDDEPALSLSPDDIAALPPTFIAASTDDQDVPFKTSKTLSRAAPNARMMTAYYLEHDFDRDTSNPAGAQAYAAALAFLDAQMAADA